jgi:hypothetical protein
MKQMFLPSIAVALASFNNGDRAATIPEHQNYQVQILLSKNKLVWQGNTEKLEKDDNFQVFIPYPKETFLKKGNYKLITYSQIKSQTKKEAECHI